MFAVTKVQMGRVVGELIRQSFCQFSGRINLAIKNIDLSFTDSLSAKIGFKDRRYLIFPGHFHRSTVVQYDDHIGLNF